MGILDRFSLIMKSNINALLDKVEDPAKVIDQTLRDLRENLADVKKETAGIMADEQEAKRRVDELQAQVDRYNSAAIVAVRAGNDADARKLLAAKQETASTLEDAKRVYEAAHDNSAKMQQMYDKLTSDIEQLEMRKDSIKGKMSAARAQEKVNQVTSRLGDSSSSISAFERAEAKANRAFDAAMAGAALDQGPKDDAASLADKYAGPGGDQSVDDELAAIKAQLGKE